MPFILRIDVDKPYPRSNLAFKLYNKLIENYGLPDIKLTDYLKHLKLLIEYINLHDISAYIYFRNCTMPDRDMIAHLIRKHRIGFHAENTLNFETFNNELNAFKTVIQSNLDSFTKHGSGTLKLGKNHYPPYEEEKYLEFAKQAVLPFRFGNGKWEPFRERQEEKNFFPNMFWIHRSYRDSGHTIESIVSEAKTKIIPLLIHPSNFHAEQQVKSDFESLVSMSFDKEITWL